MKLLKVLELVAKVILFVLSSEADPALTAGGAKHARVSMRIKEALEVPQSPPLASLADIEEILSVIDELIKALVALFNLLGLFHHRKPAPG